MLYRSFLKLWLLPPMLNVLLVALGLLLLARFRRLGLAMCILGLGSLLALSTPLVSNALLSSTEVAGALSVDDARLDGAGAIVVLGGGHLDDVAEFAAPWPTSDAQARLSYAAWLHRDLGLPLMLTGGVPAHSSSAHAEVSDHYLQALFGLQAQWLENRSRTTWENAENAATILLPQDITTIVLVTQSMHMRRAIILFERAGFDVIPAPTELAERNRSPWQVARWLPNTRSLHNSSMVMHEMLGYWWYRLRGY